MFDKYIKKYSNTPEGCIVEYFIQTAIVYGIVMLVVRSSMLDEFRRWRMSITTIQNPNGTVDQMWSNTSQPVLYRLFIKLINCYICVSWWSGIILSLNHIGPFGNPILSGLYSVGSVAFYQYFIDNMRQH